MTVHPNIAAYAALIASARGSDLSRPEWDKLITFCVFPPTDEQLVAVENALTRENLVITAGAGTGKTSTLKLIAFALDLAFGLKGIYVAYNKAIATEAAASFPANVECRTAHSFAYRAVGYQFKAKLNAGRMTGAQIARVLGLDESYPWTPRRAAS